MSRYLSQLAQETRSTLRPPSSLRLAPRAALYREIHEERLVTPPPSELQHPVDRAPAMLPPSPEMAAPHITPQAEAPKPAARPSPSPDSPRSINQPAKTTSQPAAKAPAAAKAEAGPNLHEQPGREMHREIVETLRSEFSPPDDSRPRTKAPASPEFVIPEPVRQWFHVDRDRPASAAARRSAPTPAPAFQPAPQPVIDVTIDRVEVTIESEPHAPLLAVRRPDPRGATPARPAPPPGAGRLARQYLDR